MHPRKEKAISNFHRIVQEKGGTIVSGEYENARSKFVLKCSENHVWEDEARDIVRDYWCRICVPHKGKLTINEVRAEIEKRGGKLLSSEYEHARKKLDLECQNAHAFEMSINDIKNGRWCPYCKYISEGICRSVFEQLFNAKFPKIRPTWLINENGNRLELDGYCSQLNLAFEHNGIQHYEIGNFHDTEELFKKRQSHDKIKEEVCSKLGITLITIPQLDYRNPTSGLKEIIRQEAIKLGFSLPINFDSVSINTDKIYSSKQLDKYIDIALSRGITHVSGVYINAHSKQKWRCKYNHEFFMSCNNIMSGRGCRECYNLNRFFASAEQEKEILNRYQLGESSKSIAASYNCDPSTVLEIIKKHKIPARKGGSASKLSDIDRQQILMMIDQKISKELIAKLFNCSVGTIYNTIKRNEVKSSMKILDE